MPHLVAATTKNDIALLNAAIADGLEAHNTANIPANVQNWAYGIYDGDTLLAGIAGKEMFNWCHISLLWVSEDARGQGYGRKLMAMVEDHAKEKSLSGIQVDTLSFQAPDFYPKLGYTEFGRIPDMPEQGHTRLYFYKHL